DRVTVQRDSVEQSLRFERGEVRMDLALTTADGHPAPQPLDQFPVECRPANSPVQDTSMGLYPQQIDFGYVLAGEAATRTIVLKQGSMGPDIVNISVAGKGSTLFSHSDQCRASVSQAQSCSIDMTYSSPTPGLNEAVLRVEIARRQASEL